MSDCDIFLCPLLGPCSSRTIEQLSLAVNSTYSAINHPGSWRILTWNMDLSLQPRLWISILTVRNTAYLPSLPSAFSQALVCIKPNEGAGNIWRQKGPGWGLPWKSVVKNPPQHNAGTWVWSLRIWELRSHMPTTQPKKKKQRKRSVRLVPYRTHQSWRHSLDIR